MALINKSNAFMEFPLQIARQYNGPIERYSVFYDLDSATTYASTNPLAYVGQIIAVVDENANESVAYIISNTDGDLVEIGSGSSQPMMFVADEAEMLALAEIEIGQQVYREDTHTIFIYKGGDIATLTNWVESAAASDTVWYGTENKVIFYNITQSGYDALETKSADTLYFVSDTKRIYKGSAELTQSVVVTESTPDVASAVVDKLYINPSSLEVKITVDNATWLTMSPGYLTDGATWANAASGKLATIGLIKKGIQEAIDSISTDAQFDSTTGAVKVGDGSEAVLTGVTHGITYDASTLTITVPQYGQAPLEINIPKDKFVTAGKYYEDYPEDNPTVHKVIVLTIENQENPVIIPAQALVDIYTADNESKNLVVTISSDNKISAQLILDPNSNNALTYSDKGFLVDVSGKLDRLTGCLGQKLVISNTDGSITESGYGIQAEGDLTESTNEIAVNAVIYAALAKKVNLVDGVEGNIMIFGSNGSIVDSGKKFGGEELEASASVNTVASEAGVRKAIDDALNWGTIG